MKLGKLKEMSEQLEVGDSKRDGGNVYKRNINLVDVRKPSEYESEHVESVKNSPLDYINSEEVKIDNEKENYIYCRSGYRSVVYCSILKVEGNP